MQTLVSLLVLVGCFGLGFTLLWVRSLRARDCRARASRHVEDHGKRLSRVEQEQAAQGERLSQVEQTQQEHAETVGPLRDIARIIDAREDVWIGEPTRSARAAANPEAPGPPTKRSGEWPRSRGPTRSGGGHRS